MLNLFFVFKCLILKRKENKNINDWYKDYENKLCQTDIEFYNFYQTIKKDILFINPLLLINLLNNNYIFTSKNALKLVTLFRSLHGIDNNIKYEHIIYSNVLDWWELKRDIHGLIATKYYGNNGNIPTDCNNAFMVLHKNRENMMNNLFLKY